MIVFLLTSFFLTSTLLAILIHFYGQTDRQQSADAIVVLAGPFYRADHAATLWRQGVAPYIVCNGGFLDQRQLSELCQQHLLAIGIPEEAIVLENFSLSTEEHALYLKPIMEQHGWRSVVITSNGYHLFRAMLIFKQYNIVAYPSPALSDNPHEFYPALVFREVIATEWHVFKTLLGLRYTRVDQF